MINSMDFRVLLKDKEPKKIVEQDKVIRGSKIEVQKLQERRLTPQKYLRDLGYKIKEEIPTKTKLGIKFYSNDKANDAYLDLIEGNFRIKFELDGDSIYF